MPVRSTVNRDIPRFLGSLKSALALRLGDPGVSTAIAELEPGVEARGSHQVCEPFRLPVCVHLPGALERARLASEAMGNLVESFAAIEPLLRWARRPAGGPHASDSWLEGHANAMIIGPAGLERRGDLQVGVSLMAPRVRYPDHSHAPEEVYVVLSPGRFKHGTTAWVEPGIGGTFHNVPNVTHAMASDDAPLLAIWSLWND
jgi:hypothetical protein